MSPNDSKVLSIGCYVFVAVVIAGFLAAVAVAIIVMDSLTYGHPPGLFKNDTWQAIRQLWN